MYWGFSGKYVVGTCEQMCPTAEITMRKSKNLTHFYEKNGKYVKEFSRSAADKKMKKPGQIRTFDALQKTLDYLFNTILRDSQKPLNFRYDFIFDRCRAIRQEIVMQNFSCAKTVILLEPMIMFLSYSLYQLNGLSISHFDSKICTQHLQECLHKCLGCYEEMDVSKEVESYQLENRVIFEAINLMLNISDRSALLHALRLDLRLKTTFTLKTAIRTAISFHQKNFHRLLRDIRDLPHLVGAIASLNLAMIRKEVLKVFSIAYNSSQPLKVPLKFLQRLLIYDEETTLVGHLRDLSIYDGKDDDAVSAVVFSRQNFDSSKNIPNTMQHFVDQKLCDFHLPDLILVKTV